MASIGQVRLLAVWLQYSLAYACMLHSLAGISHGQGHRDTPWTSLKLQDRIVKNAVTLNNERNAKISYEWCASHVTVFQLFFSWEWSVSVGCDIDLHIIDCVLKEFSLQYMISRDDV